MRQRAGRMNPFESMVRQRQRGEKWRPGSKWIHGRSEVMKKAGQSELECPCCASRLGLRFENGHLQSSLGENNGRCETIRTSTDDARFAGHLGFFAMERFLLFQLLVDVHSDYRTF